VPFERPPRRWPVWALVVLSAAAVATLAVVRVGPDKGQPAASSVLPVPRSTQAPLHQAPSPSAPVVHGIAAVLRLSGRCWIEATVDGTVMPGQVFLPGKPLRLHARHSLQLVLGNAGAVKLTVNGRRET